jgi:hypothetical protein
MWRRNYDEKFERQLNCPPGASTIGSNCKRHLDLEDLLGHGE